MNCPIHGDVYIGWRWVEFHFLSCIAVSRILCEPYFWAIPRVGPGDDGDIKSQRGPVHRWNFVRPRRLGLVRGAFPPYRVIQRTR